MIVLQLVYSDGEVCRPRRSSRRTLRQTWLQVLKKRSFLALIWIVGAAIVAGIDVLIFG